MALLEKSLVVKKSTIPGAGKGLFTRVSIPKDTRIVEYKGRITVWKEVANDSDNGYIYSVNSKHVIDAKRTLSALARYANDARGLTRIKGITNNCDYINDGTRVYITSKRAIDAGEEILVSYGKEYWDVIRENIKKDEKESRKKENDTSAKKKKTTSRQSKR